MDPNAGNPDNNPPSVNQLTNFESVVGAAREAAAAQTTPKAQFENQFGSPQAATPPVADSATGQGLIDTALANLGTPPPPPPAGEEITPTPQPEEAPLDRKQKFVDGVLKLVEEFKAEEENKAA